MKNNNFNIEFEFDGKQMKGWVHPSEQVNDTGAPVSFHVVLNGTSFGYLSFLDCKWIVNQDRPAGLIKLVGKQIEKRYQF